MKKIVGLLLLGVFSTQAQENINEVKNLFPEHESQLNIPFNHSYYATFEKGVYEATTIHTAVKPYVFEKVAQPSGIERFKQRLLKDKKSWAGRKLWNEHLFQVKKDDFWFTTDFVFDLDLGRDNTDIGNTITNARILKLEGQIGKQLSFSSTMVETQAVFSDYINQFIALQSPEDGFGVIPGRGKSKRFGEDGHDYGISTGYLSYTPSKYFNFQFGYGQNFIGDGYRSLFLSDVAAPRTYLKSTTTVGKLQYTNIWTWLRDLRPSIDANIDVNNINNAAHKRSYGVFHHLSWNVNDRLNLGFFEGIMTDNNGTSGTLAADYFVPVIFYKNVEFANGEDGGSGAVGVNAKYKVAKNTYTYGQFFLDEFTAEEFFSNKDYWGNKYAFQLGVKSFDVFGIKGWYAQAEYNHVRPFTYSHEEQHNYAHFGQPLSHLWGGNFHELVFITRYNKERWSGNLKIVFGEKGFDNTTAKGFDDETTQTASTDTSSGGNIFIPSGFRNGDRGHEFLQGNKATIFHVDAEVSYLINPSNNFKLFAGALLRNFSSDAPISSIGIDPRSGNAIDFDIENTNWFRVGVKVDLFNRYNDF